MAGYTRQSTADIIPTATVRAAPINAEYNAIRDAFAASGGHKHDGTTGEGEYVPLIADLDALNKIVVDTNNNRFGVFVEVSATAVEQVRFQDGVIVPVTDNDIDLGTSSVEFKNLYLDGTAKIDTLTVDENATIAGTLGVTSNTTLGGTLGVTGATTLSSTLGVTGNTTLSGTLGVTGATTLSSTLAVSGSATLSSTLSVSSNATVGGNLAVSGTTSSTGDFSVNTNKFTVAASSGNTAVAGTLGVTGATTVGGTLGVTGATTLSSTAAITGNTTIGGTLGVTGTTSYSTLTGSNLTATGTINFSGATVSNLGTVSTAAIGGGTINNTVIGGSTPAAITGTTVTATSFVGPVTGNITGDVTGDLTGNVTAASGASTFNNVTINGTLDVTNTTIENVSDPTTAQQAATKAYVDSEITNLIGGAPGALDTLNELAAAINDDANVYTTLTTSIATKLPKAGGTMTGAIAMGDNKITGLATPTAAADATTKAYVDQIETDAEAQATAAAASAAAAAASYDAFDDRYLGSKASDPTLDNDGNALLTGALYFDSTNSVMKVYNGTEWANASSSIEGVKSNFYYTATSGQTVFSGADDNANTLVVDQVDLVNVYMNGVRLHEDDYTVSAAGNSVTLATGAATDDLIYLEVFGNFAGQSGAEVAITGGNIDGTTIGANSAAAITGTTITGTSFVSSGNMTFGDNDKAIFGAGSDLQIYHDSATNDSIIKESGAGHLRILGDDVKIRDVNNAEMYIDAVKNGAVGIYYDNSRKLATTSTGIDVSGTVTADGLTVDGIATLNAVDPYVRFNASTSVDYNIGASSAGGFYIYDVTNSATRLFADDNGDISFYDSVGSSQAFFWDASAESLGIGTTSINSLASLHIQGSDGASGASVNIAANEFFIDNNGNTGMTLGSSNTGTGYYAFADSDVALRGGIFYDHSTDDMGFRVGSGTRMRIDSSGSLLVGKDITNLYENGFAALSSGEIRCTADSTIPLEIRRNTDSGDIVKLWKDASAFGTLGVAGGDLYIGNSGIAVRFDNSLNAITSFNNNTQQNSDAAIDLGASSRRFKDLYLSGGVYLGGTGSANKLDDYETGTWTPAIEYDTNGTLSVTYSQRNGAYTKVGNMVTIWGVIRLNGFSKGTASGSLKFTGLPFSSTAAGYRTDLKVLSYRAPFNGPGGFGAMIDNGSSYIACVYSRNDNTWTAEADPDSNSEYFFSGSYFATA